MSVVADTLRHHAFLDLETTGLDPSSDEVIEVGIVFVERGEVVRRVGKLFRPSRSVPLTVEKLTGLSEEVLAPERPFFEFIPTLRKLLAGWTVVAHNAVFERRFLHGLLEELEAPVLDSCELLHLLHPELQSHALEAAVRWAGVGEGTSHRALEDAEDTFRVVAHALEQVVVASRAEEVAELLAVLAPGGTQLSLTDAVEATPLIELLERLGGHARRQRAPLTLEPQLPHLPALPGRVRRVGAGPTLPAEALLGAGSPLIGALPGFEPRPLQQALARRVGETLREGGLLAAEVGPAGGKTLGALVPAIAHAVAHREKVLVLGATRASQQRLVETELPRLHAALDGGFGWASLKPQTAYVCRRKALALTRGKPELPWPERAARAYLRAFLRRHPEGDLEKVSLWFKERYPALLPLLEAVRSEPATTLAEACPHFKACAFHSARAHAAEADVVAITPAHALQWPEALPPAQALIVEEAHGLEEADALSRTRELSSRTLALLQARLLGSEGLEPRLSTVAPELGRELRARAAEVALDGPVLQGALAAFVGLPGLERRISPEGRQRREWVRVRDALHGLWSSLDRLARVLEGRRAALAPALEGALSHDCAGALAAARELMALVEALADHPGLLRCDAARVDGEAFVLKVTPLDTAAQVQQQLRDRYRSVVLTSATLSVGPQAPFVLDTLGLVPGEEGVSFERFGTSDDLPVSALVLLVEDAPEARGRAFAPWAAQRLSGLGRFLGGRTLGLFTSTAQVEAVAALVRRELEPDGVEVLIPSRGALQRRLEHERESEGTVLLGGRALWSAEEGSVACAFLEALPLDFDGGPLREAREALCGDLAVERQRLPRALLLLRQAAHWVLRGERGRGVVVLASPGDPAWRAQVYEALEGYRVEALPWAQARVRLFHALKVLGVSAGPLGRRPAAPLQGELFG